MSGKEEEDIESTYENFQIEDAENDEIGEEVDTNSKNLKFSSFMKRLGFENEAETDEKSNVPGLSYLEVFKLFLWFGCRAFGGPGFILHYIIYFFYLIVLSQILSTI